MKTRKLLALVLAAALVLGAAPLSRAETSAQIQDRIDELTQAQAQNQQQMDALESQLNSNWESIEEMVQYKNSIDSQIFLLYSQVDNLDEQIAIYTDLIAQTQEQLDTAQEELRVLNEKYKSRIRAMEEAGEISYWSVIFKSSSFADLMDRLNMMQEIAALDRRMMEELTAAAEAVAESKAALEQEMASLTQAREDLILTEAELAEKREETDRVLAQLNEQQSDLEAEHSHCSDANNDILQQIAQAELEFYEAQKAEEEERRRQEEEERRRQEEEERRQQEEQQNQATAPTEPEETVKPTDPETTEPEETEPEETEPEATEPEATEPEATEPEETEPEETEPEESGWLQPCEYSYISSSYGNRASGFHNGVDFAAPQGTPIYATRSGTVTTATALKNSKGEYISYGNYVVINHGDGFSSLYAHMTYFVVEAGATVKQGDLIGYVGSTGNSTGNHLHFTVFYLGKTVNPMNYL